jgi:hypothetical protein
MFEYEYRSREQISREAAERYAHMEAVAARKAEAKHERRQQHRSAVRTEPVQAR